MSQLVVNIDDLCEMAMAIYNKPYIDNLHNIHDIFLKNHTKDESSDETYIFVYEWIYTCYNNYMDMYICGFTNLMRMIILEDTRISLPDNERRYDYEKQIEELVDAYGKDLADINKVYDYVEKTRLLDKATDDYLNDLDQLSEDLRKLKESIGTFDIEALENSIWEDDDDNEEKEYRHEHSYGYGY